MDLLVPVKAAIISLGRGQQREQGLPGNAPRSSTEADSGEAAVPDHTVDGAPGQTENLGDFIGPEHLLFHHHFHGLISFSFLFMPFAGLWDIWYASHGPIHI
jgi:hypothetical protein